MHPEPERIACHQAGHAVMQSILARGRYRVAAVSLYGEGSCTVDRKQPCGFARLDRETELNLYEYGLAQLSGIAAENRFLREHPPEGEDLRGAVSDIQDWQDTAMGLYRDEGRVRMLSMNIMAKLDAIFNESPIWNVVNALAEALLEKQTVAGDELQAILAELP